VERDVAIIDRLAERAGARSVALVAQAY